MLAEKLERKRMHISRQLLLRCKPEGDEFCATLSLTREENSVHNFEPENKRQYMEYRHKRSPTPNKLKIAPSAGKVMLTAFRDVNGVVHSEFMPTGTTINSEHYFGTQQILTTRIPRVRPNM
jgi:hypothetical protein